MSTAALRTAAVPITDAVDPDKPHSLLDLEADLLASICQAAQRRPDTLACLAATCSQMHSAGGRYIASLRRNVWEDCNVMLQGNSAHSVCVAAGEAEKWIDWTHVAKLEMYESRESLCSSKDVTGPGHQPGTGCCAMDDCRADLGDFHAGDHYERFNRLHGYWTLSAHPTPLGYSPDWLQERYQQGRGYPYVGMSATAAPNMPSTLCMHPSEDEETSVVVAFVCPADGLYVVSNLAIALHDERAPGPVTLELRMLCDDVYISSSAGGAPDPIQVYHKVRLGDRDGYYGLSVTRERRSHSADGPVALELKAGDRIAFAVSAAEFSYAACRVSWRIRKGLPSQ